MREQDIKLIDHGGYYDFNIMDDGDIESDDSFNSSLIVSLLVDKRAESYEVPTPQDRRGWIGSISQEHKIGSKLWLYSQTRALDVDAQRIKNEVLSATKHFVEDGLVKEMTAEASLIDGVLSFTLNIFRYNSKVDKRYFELWNNTGE